MRVSPELKGVAKKVRGTLWIKVNPMKPQTDLIRIAANVIRKGGLVAFPTETVYGLGANALDSDAVANIFKAKERPPDNPVIVHIANKKDMRRLARTVPHKAEELATKFWPGPLTLILKRSSIVPDVTAAGLDTVGIRMPSNKIALALIRMSRVPIAAPSANRAGKPSPTTAQHVIDDLAGRIDVILDGGSTRIGIESTVIDLTRRVPQILRPGGTPFEELKGLFGAVTLHPAAFSEKRATLLRALAPGMKHRHYAPKAEMILVEGNPDKIMKRVRELAAFSMADGKRVGILATDESMSNYDGDVLRSLGSRSNMKEVARNLFKLLREFDDEKVDVIIAEGVPLRGLGLAVMNRLRRAASFNVLKAT